MEFSVLVVFVVSMSAAFIISEVQPYETNSPIFGNLQGSVLESSNVQDSSLLNAAKENTRLNDIDLSLEKQNIELENIRETLDALVEGAESEPGAHPLANAVEEAWRQALAGKGLSPDAMEEIFKGEMHRLHSRLNSFGKRGRSKFSVQTRFAPFGTKLVPNRKLENGGATLLRYGRSAHRGQRMG